MFLEGGIGLLPNAATERLGRLKIPRGLLYDMKKNIKSRPALRNAMSCFSVLICTKSTDGENKCRGCPMGRKKSSSGLNLGDGSPDRISQGWKSLLSLSVCLPSPLFFLTIKAAL
ncbi:hypothetical protein CDAR_60351 [Caerostris darwini]|uniref:Uncharacterized protein n=1 Tax=Caerostris darwini TaxID=1538125 RepID=A0AAV4QLH7_9ARAC|nr:hypothetical protein CDAR_60351 [Caerostris darwini]